LRSGATVSFGADITPGTLTVSSATQASASISIGDAAALGVRGVTLTNPDGQASTLASSFTVRDFAPAVVSVEPASLGLCTSGSVVVKGYHFRTGLTLSFGQGVTVNGVTMDSENSLTVSIAVASNATAGARNVTVTNPDNQSATGNGLFQIPAPTYVSA